MANFILSFECKHLVDPLMKSLLLILAHLLTTLARLLGPGEAKGMEKPSNHCVRSELILTYRQADGIRPHLGRPLF